MVRMKHVLTISEILKDVDDDLILDIECFHEVTVYNQGHNTETMLYSVNTSKTEMLDQLTDQLNRILERLVNNLEGYHSPLRGKLEREASWEHRPLLAEEKDDF